jgi:hypothetical protein
MVMAKSPLIAVAPLCAAMHARLKSERLMRCRYGKNETAAVSASKGRGFETRKALNRLRFERRKQRPFL